MPPSPTTENQQWDSLLQTFKKINLGNINTKEMPDAFEQAAALSGPKVFLETILVPYKKTQTQIQTQTQLDICGLQAFLISDNNWLPIEPKQKLVRLVWNNIFKLEDVDDQAKYFTLMLEVMSETRKFLEERYRNINTVNEITSQQLQLINEPIKPHHIDDEDFWESFKTCLIQVLPKLGYAKTSHTYMMFLRVLVEGISEFFYHAIDAMDEGELTQKVGRDLVATVKSQRAESKGILEAIANALVRADGLVDVPYIMPLIECFFSVFDVLTNADKVAVLQGFNQEYGPPLSIVLLYTELDKRDADVAVTVRQAIRNTPYLHGDFFEENLYGFDIPASFREELTQQGFVKEEVERAKINANISVLGFVSLKTQQNYFKSHARQIAKYFSNMKLNEKPQEFPLMIVRLVKSKEVDSLAIFLVELNKSKAKAAFKIVFNQIMGLNPDAIWARGTCIFNKLVSAIEDIGLECEEKEVFSRRLFDKVKARTHKPFLEMVGRNFLDISRAAEFVELNQQSHTDETFHLCWALNIMLIKHSDSSKHTQQSRRARKICVRLLSDKADAMHNHYGERKDYLANLLKLLTDNSILQDQRDVVKGMLVRCLPQSQNKFLAGIEAFQKNCTITLQKRVDLLREFSGDGEQVAQQHLEILFKSKDQAWEQGFTEALADSSLESLLRFFKVVWPRLDKSAASQQRSFKCKRMLILDAYIKARLVVAKPLAVNVYPYLRFYVQACLEHAAFFEENKSKAEVQVNQLIDSAYRYAVKATVDADVEYYGDLLIDRGFAQGRDLFSVEAGLLARAKVKFDNNKDFREQVFASSCLPLVKHFESCSPRAAYRVLQLRYKAAEELPPSAAEVGVILSKLAISYQDDREYLAAQQADTVHVMDVCDFATGLTETQHRDVYFAHIKSCLLSEFPKTKRSEAQRVVESPNAEVLEAMFLAMAKVDRLDLVADMLEHFSHHDSVYQVYENIKSQLRGGKQEIDCQRLAIYQANYLYAKAKQQCKKQNEKGSVRDNDFILSSFKTLFNLLLISNPDKAKILLKDVISKLRLVQDYACCVQALQFAKSTVEEKSLQCESSIMDYTCSQAAEIFELCLADGDLNSSEALQSLIPDNVLVREKLFNCYEALIQEKTNAMQVVPSIKECDELAKKHVKARELYQKLKSLIGDAEDAGNKLFQRAQALYSTALDELYPSLKMAHDNNKFVNFKKIYSIAKAWLNLEKDNVLDNKFEGLYKATRAKHDQQKTERLEQERLAAERARQAQELVARQEAERVAAEATRIAVQPRIEVVRNEHQSAASTTKPTTSQNFVTTGSSTKTTTVKEGTTTSNAQKGLLETPVQTPMPVRQVDALHQGRGGSRARSNGRGRGIGSRGRAPAESRLQKRSNADGQPRLSNEKRANTTIEKGHQTVPSSLLGVAPKEHHSTTSVITRTLYDTDTPSSNTPCDDTTSSTGSSPSSPGCSSDTTGTPPTRSFAKFWREGTGNNKCLDPDAKPFMSKHTSPSTESLDSQENQGDSLRKQPSTAGKGEQHRWGFVLTPNGS